MKSIVIIFAVTILFAVGLVLVDPESKFGPETADSIRNRALQNTEPTKDSVETPVVVELVAHAAGSVEGMTETIDLVPQMSERITRVPVELGQWVKKGDLLVELDTEQCQNRVDLAKARWVAAKARRDRLVNGARDSEIARAKHSLAAANAELMATEKQYQRTVRLHDHGAASGQSLDDTASLRDVLIAKVASAQASLDLLADPPRADELDAAEGDADAAEAQWQIAKAELARCSLRAPCEAQVLEINGEVGELSFPNQPTPTIRLSNTRRLRVVAEIDEFDAMKVRPGMPCRIFSDASKEVLARGTVSVSEPTMKRKTMFGEWAGERSDSHVRRIWIELRDAPKLPVGLPVDVYIDSAS